MMLVGYIIDSVVEPYRICVCDMAFNAYIHAICLFCLREVETLKEEVNLRSF